MRIKSHPAAGQEPTFNCLGSRKGSTSEQAIPQLSIESGSLSLPKSSWLWMTIEMTHWSSWMPGWHYSGSHFLRCTSAAPLRAPGMSGVMAEDCNSRASTSSPQPIAHKSIVVVGKSASQQVLLKTYFSNLMPAVAPR